jgi:hypothetical protein
MGAIFVVEFDGLMWVKRVNKAEDIIFRSFGGIGNGKVDACIVPEKTKKRVVSELHTQSIAFNPRHPCSGRCTPRLLASPAFQL